MKLARKVLAAALSLAWFPASANVLVHVRIATQRMTVSVSYRSRKYVTQLAALQSSHP